MSALLFGFVVACTVVAIVLGAGYYAVHRLMETDEDQLLNRANKEIESRKRLRPF